MPAIDSPTLGIAFDMAGCPNRCRHCCLGAAGRDRLTVEDVRRITGAFRDHFAGTAVERLTVASWIWEPDFDDAYRELHELEAELSDTAPARYELLSVWRLARDESYAPWARSAGPRTCQVTLFGTEETTDWFCRRRGAFRDALTATERLLDAGMIPRWQLILTRRLLPEADELLRLVDRMALRERVEALGEAFDVFVNLPSPEGAARDIENLRPTLADVGSLPGELIESSRRHFGEPEALWFPEGELVARIAADEPAFPHTCAMTDPPWFLVTGSRDVYANMGGMANGWCLGNLGRDPVGDIVGRFERNDTPGLRTIHETPAAALARTYGDPDGDRLYSDVDDLLGLYVARAIA